MLPSPVLVHGSRTGPHLPLASVSWIPNIAGISNCFVWSPIHTENSAVSMRGVRVFFNLAHNRISLLGGCVCVCSMCVLISWDLNGILLESHCRYDTDNGMIRSIATTRLDCFFFIPFTCATASAAASHTPNNVPKTIFRLIQSHAVCTSYAKTTRSSSVATANSGLCVWVFFGSPSLGFENVLCEM